MNGLHWSDTKAGRVFSQSATPLGLAIPIYTATALGGAGICAYMLYNPPGSNVDVEVISHDINYASGTADYGAVGIMGVPLGGVATGAMVTAMATTVPINAYLGGGLASKISSNNSANTVTATAGTAGAPTATAPGWIRGIAAQNLEAQTATAHGLSGFTYSWNGTLCVPSGYAIWVAAMRATTAALYCGSVVWKEISTQG